jgi:hypothetical protein
MTTPLDATKLTPIPGIEIRVGIPNMLSKLLTEQRVSRLLRIDAFSEFYYCSLREKAEIIFKVALVGLAVLGIGYIVSIMNPLAVWAVPLSLILAMGLTFDLLTESKRDAAIKKMKAPESIESSKEIVFYGRRLQDGEKLYHTKKEPGKIFTLKDLQKA